MKQSFLYLNYFKKTSLIWILFLICIYIVCACEFELLRISMFSVNKGLEFVDKINKIIENLSFSYIAGVIFFSLSDTIPFLRRKKIASKGIEKSLVQMNNAIDDFSLSINNSKWNKDTNTKLVFEEFSGGEYAENAPQIKLTSDKISLVENLTKKIDQGIDFIISYELYADTNLINDMTCIKFNDQFLFLRSISNNSNNDFYFSADSIIAVFDEIIEIKNKILKYL